MCLCLDNSQVQHRYSYVLAILKFVVLKKCQVIFFLIVYGHSLKVCFYFELLLK